MSAPSSGVGKPAPTPRKSNKGLWTVLIVFGGLFAVFGVLAMLLFTAMSPRLGPNQIGVVEVKGPIMTADQFLADFKDFNENDDIQGIVVRVDTPGGSVGASQEIAEAIRGSDKKVVISLGNVAASGGYYIAVAGPRVFANPGTITGSIGVISQSFEVDDLMSYLQIEVNTVTSGEYKDTGSPFRDFTEKDRKHYEDLVLDIYRQFVEAVAEGRGLSEEEVLPWADGRVFTGRQAHEGKLVDELGGMEAAVDWLMDDLGLEGDATLVYPPRRGAGVLDMFVQQGVSSVQRELTAINTPSFEYRYVGPGSN